MRKNIVEETKQVRLLEDIKQTRQALDTVYRNYQYVSDPDLIDCYIYEMNSMNLRYKYLLRQLESLKQVMD